MSTNFFQSFAVRTLVAGGIFLISADAASLGQSFEGFTEPIRKIDLSSDEVGALSELRVDEGSVVEEGNVIARLDSRVQELQLEVAEKMATNKTQLDAAEKELIKRTAILEKLTQLHKSGHASESETIRADMELAIAQSKCKATQQELVIREIESRRAQVQLQRRTIHAPFNGIVTKVHTREGEFLSPMHPEIVSLAQVNELVVRLNVTTTHLSTFEVGQVFNVQLGSGTTVLATVQSIGVEINAASETVEVKLAIDNSELKIRSGEKVTLSI